MSSRNQIGAPINVETDSPDKIQKTNWTGGASRYTYFKWCQIQVLSKLKWWDNIQYLKQYKPEIIDYLIKTPSWAKQTAGVTGFGGIKFNYQEWVIVSWRSTVTQVRQLLTSWHSDVFIEVSPFLTGWLSGIRGHHC